MANELYEVIDQESARLINAGGRTERGVIVTFRSKATGATGQVEIVESDLTAEHVDAAIRAKVATMNAISAL